MGDSLWGDEFELPEKPKAKDIVKKIKKEKTQTKSSAESQSAEKIVKSKKISIEDKLNIISEEVKKVLAKQANNIICIRDKETFHNYISKCVDNKIVAIDTETNNSLDPITCKLMGLCLYTPNEKQAYIPVNHRDFRTLEKLSPQLNEEDIKEELQRIIDAKTYSVLHNGKFDYEVLKCTCNVLINIDWDTMIGAKLLDENEHSAGLKQQYIDKIDSSQEKYSIDQLFNNIEYADVAPEVFAFYAATDSLMTYKLYEWQKNRFNLPENNKLLTLANTIEMPLVKVLAEMELAGMEVDMNYASLLSNKFHKKLDEVDNKINNELDKLSTKIEAWRLTPEANYKPTVGRSKTIKGITYKYMAASDGPGDMSYWYEAKSFRQLSDDEAKSLELFATEQKSKADQLTNPINLSSPVQLAILFYDILKAPVVDKKAPRSTGEEALKAISDKLHLPICDLILERRELVKLLTTYIDAIPELAKRWPDGRVRTHFNQYGAATGRLSSSDPINFQNIPSHAKEIRLLFKAKTDAKLIEESEKNIYMVNKWSEVETKNGWQLPKDIKLGTKVKIGDIDRTITAIEKYSDSQYKLTIV